MAILKMKDRYALTAPIAAAILYLVAVAFYFSPVEMAHKITIPVGFLTVASLWMCPWQMTLALFFSALGDYLGSYNFFLGQMGAFAVGHIWFIVYFINRYKKQTEQNRRFTAKEKGFLPVVLLCTLILLGVVYIKVAPGAPEGVVRIGVCVYATLICTMLMSAFLQRSALFALGAMLFVFSDFIIAWDDFVSSVQYRRYFVMVPYLLAQWLLFYRSTK